MSWVMSAYDPESATKIEVHKPDGAPRGRWGEHRFPFYLDGTNYFGYSHFDVIVYDNTKDGIDSHTACTIANEAINKNIYWSDDRVCHWMFDFQVDGHWCEGLFHNNGLDERIPEFSTLHINVYD